MIPDYQTLMLPVLKACSKGAVSVKEVIPSLAVQFTLSAEDCARLLPSGKRAIFYDRISWAKTYLKQAGLIKYPERGKFIITEEGKKILQSPPPRLNKEFLKNFDTFQDFLERSESQSDQTDSGVADDAEIETDDTTPDENLRLAYKTIRNALATELLDRVRKATHQSFERLIVDLLVAMGYGVAGRRLGGSGDGGVDGVIDQDPLGVDQVYVQAKCYTENNITPAAIRDFYGALDLKKAQKGIFFTTSEFSKSAQETAAGLGKRIVLIDGRRLSNLMIDYNIGCREEEIIKLKKIDEDFFDQE